MPHVISYIYFYDFYDNKDIVLKKKM